MNVYLDKSIQIPFLTWRKGFFYEKGCFEVSDHLIEGGIPSEGKSRSS